VAADRCLIGDHGALLLYRGSRLPGMFDIEDNDIVIIVLDVYYKLLEK